MRIGVDQPMVNVKPVHLGKNVRMSFSRINEVLEMPNLIEVQKNSYKWFLEEGLKEVFKDISEISDYQGNLVLDFIDYRLDETPKYSIEECKERDATYAAPLRVRASLLNKETGEVKEQDIFMGAFPVMTPSGTFIINGAERVIVSQLVRSPGVYYSISRDKAGKELYATTVIPNRGAWLEYETDSNDVFYVRIDKNRIFRRRPAHCGNHRKGQHQQHRGGAAGGLPQAASGRAADSGQRPEPSERPVL